MLILLLVLAIIALVTFLILRVKYPYIDEYVFDSHLFFNIMSWVFGFLVLGLIISICSMATTVATETLIDRKIEMYQEENTNIENDINKIVKEYLEHEHDTFANLKTEESSITLVTLFPELKSDTLVQQQLELYVNNNVTIKSLKEEKIDLIKLKWLLYFGK